MWSGFGILILVLSVANGVFIPSSKKNSGMLPWMSVHPRCEGLRVRQAVVCPGGQECPEFATCCKLGSGQWGCCPFPEATCCSDGVHCCPKNNHCDLAQQRCTAGDTQESVPMSQKFAASKASFASVGTITCPDRQSECPDTTTCCQMASGDWGCCPFELAICCSDKLHCCPKDTVCNLVQQRCQKASTSGLHRSTIAQPKLHHNMTENVCPDQHPCADETTCCKLKSGKYGCCPFPQADCCSDGLHCCPNGYTCDVKAGKCAKAA